MKTFLIPIILTSQLAPLFVHGQSITPGQPQSNTFNASFSNPPWSYIEDVVSASSLDNATRAGVLTALGYERSNWAGESAQSSDFYTTLPANASGASPGDLLKLEVVTNTSLYTLPPNVALSRIMFQTTNLNGTGVPASAYILWPWAPRQFNNNNDNEGEEGGGRGNLPIVAWAHGTSGWSAECGPSHIRNLWYQYSAPYILALQGYVVVAPDYAGLGVGTDTRHQTIRHQYLSTAAADDLLYAVQAAQAAFPADLGGANFVVMGHSQGGGAAWAAAQRQARVPVAGYLGTVAASPSTTPFLEAAATALWPAIAQGLDSIWPEFNISEWLSADGFERLSLLQGLQGCQSMKEELGYNLASADWVNPAFADSFYWNTYVHNMSAVGNLQISPEPMLVLQGTGDSSVPVLYTDMAVNETCQSYPESNIQYARFAGSEHVPVLFSGQRVWLAFIEELFTNAATTTTTGGSTTKKRSPTGCATTQYTPYLDVSRYQTQLAYFMEFPLYAYETA